MRFRDLPAVHFSPQPYQKLAIPATAKFANLFICPRGEVYWTYFEKGKGSTILGEDGRFIDLHPEGRDRFTYPHVQRFPDGRWLIIDSGNASVFTPDRTFIRSFYAGDGVVVALVDQDSRIWIGYSDEAIDNAFNQNVPMSHLSYRFGANGLVRLDDHGIIEFAYNQQFPTRPISDIEALTLDDDSRAWFCPEEDYFLASASADSVDFVLSRAPTLGAMALSIGRTHFAFFGGYSRSSIVILVDREMLRLRLLQLHHPNGTPLSPRCVASRGPRAIAVAADGVIFKLNQDILLGVLGPWTDNNSSTLESAVQYLDEEKSYSGMYAFGSQYGLKFVQGKPRPPQNQRRREEDPNP